MDFAKKANRPDIFKLNMTPKFHFYRDEVGERMLSRQAPSTFSYNVLNKFDERGHPQRAKSINKMEERHSLLPLGNLKGSLIGVQKNASVKKLKPLSEA